MQTLQSARDKLTSKMNTLHDKLKNQDDIMDKVKSKPKQESSSFTGGSSSASDIVDDIIKDMPTVSMSKKNSKSISETNGFKSAENTTNNNKMNYISDE